MGTESCDHLIYGSWDMVCNGPIDGHMDIWRDKQIQSDIRRWMSHLKITTNSSSETLYVKGRSKPIVISTIIKNTGFSFQKYSFINTQTFND